MSITETILQPYNGYTRVEDEDGNPVDLIRINDIVTDREVAMQVRDSLREVVFHLRILTGETPDPLDLEEISR